MKIGMFTAGYDWNPLEHVFIDCKRFGYDYIELYGTRPHAYAPDLVRGEDKQIRTLMEKYETPIPIYTPEHNLYAHNFMLGTQAQWEDTIEYLKTCMDAAKILNAGSMLISVARGEYQASYRELWERLERTMRVLTEAAEQKQIKLIVETLTPFETNFFTRANDLVELFEGIDSPWLTGMCDVVAPFVEYENALSYIDKLGDKMTHIHFIDGKHGSCDHLVPGEGDLPLREMLSEIKYAGYDGTMTLELVGAYMNEPRLYNKRAIDNFRKIESEL